MAVAGLRSPAKKALVVPCFLHLVQMGQWTVISVLSFPLKKLLFLYLFLLVRSTSGFLRWRKRLYFQTACCLAGLVGSLSNCEPVLSDSTVPCSCPPPPLWMENALRVDLSQLLCYTLLSWAWLLESRMLKWICTPWSGSPRSPSLLLVYSLAEGLCVLLGLSLNVLRISSVLWRDKFGICKLCFWWFFWLNKCLVLFRIEDTEETNWPRAT